MPDDDPTSAPRHAAGPAPRRFTLTQRDPAATARHRVAEDETAERAGEPTDGAGNGHQGHPTADHAARPGPSAADSSTADLSTDDRPVPPDDQPQPSVAAARDAEDDAPERPASGPAAATPEVHGRERLRRALQRPGRGQLIAAVLLLLFGAAVVIQVRITTEDSAYANARREDLIQLLDGLTQENRRLEGELSDLERTRSNLETGADAQQVARAEAERRIEVLSILAGTVPAEGQGIRMEIGDPQNKVGAEILLDAVQEMRDAGAEVIEINDSIRLVSSSWFANGPDGIVVDGKPVDKPITIEVIGDPHSLSEGANFRGGLVSEITSSRVGGTVRITELQTVAIDSLHTPKPPQYAQPASAEPTR